MKERAALASVRSAPGMTARYSRRRDRAVAQRASAARSRPRRRRVDFQVGGDVGRVALDRLDVATPGEGFDAARIAREDAHPVAGRQQPRHETPPEIPGGAKDEGARRRPVGTGLGDERGFTAGGGGQLAHAEKVRPSPDIPGGLT